MVQRRDAHIMDRLLGRREGCVSGATSAADLNDHHDLRYLCPLCTIFLSMFLFPLF